MIRIEALSFTRAEGFRLSVPGLSVAEGERVAVVGPSGSGKTTLLSLLAGLLLPQAGRVHVAGTEVSALPDAGRRAFRAATIGFVFQNFALVEYLSAAGNVVYPYRISDALRLDAGVHARAAELLQAMGLGDRAGAKPGTLSQGEQQRVAIARALIARPRLVLADEPTGNLDPDTTARVLDLLFAQVAASGATLLAVTHDHALLPRFDRVIDFADFRGDA